METCVYPALKRAHARRLRDNFRSAGWPFQDVIEIELLAAGLLERVTDARGVDCVRVTDAGIQYLAGAAQSNRQALSAHNALVDHVAQAQLREGRIVWTGLAMRAGLPHEEGTPILRGWVVQANDLLCLYHRLRQILPIHTNRTEYGFDSITMS